MTKEEALIGLFDNVVWAIDNKIYTNKRDREKLTEELKQVIASFESGATHEHYKRINGVWTHSKSFQGYAVANNCANKRTSFLVVLRGSTLSVGDRVTLLNVGNHLKLEPNEVRSGLVREDSRIMRVFVNSENELKAFLEAI